MLSQSNNSTDRWITNNQSSDHNDWKGDIEIYTRNDAGCHGANRSRFVKPRVQGCARPPINTQNYQNYLMRQSHNHQIDFEFRHDGNYQPSQVVYFIMRLEGYKEIISS